MGYELGAPPPPPPLLPPPSPQEEDDDDDKKKFFIDRSLYNMIEDERANNMLKLISKPV